jgi:uncharacterized hydrophobic protein (TIGR00271 family)
VLHLRLIVPPDLTPAVLGILGRAPDVTNVWQLRGAAAKPPGDLVSCDVAKEEASALLRALQDLGLERRGSIAVEEVDASVSLAAEDAERAAPGSPADAVVWEEVEGRLSESAALSVSFLVLITIATMIGAIGVITDSIVLIIGAMVVGPEYGPLAGICVALVEGRTKLAARSLAALAVGFPAGIVAAALLTLGLVAAGVAPDALDPGQRELTLFISQPNWYAVIVAALAGTVGMVALLGAKSGALIGVLISITTIPAAANVGVAAAYGTWDEAAGAAAHLAINVAAIIGSGLVVLAISRRRRLRPHP